MNRFKKKKMQVGKRETNTDEGEKEEKKEGNHREENESGDDWKEEEIDGESDDETDNDHHHERDDSKEMKLNQMIGILFRIMIIISATLYTLWLLQFHPGWYDRFKLYY